MMSNRHHESRFSHTPAEGATTMKTRITQLMTFTIAVLFVFGTTINAAEVTTNAVQILNADTGLSTTGSWRAADSRLP